MTDELDIPIRRTSENPTAGIEIVRVLPRHSPELTYRLPGFWRGAAMVREEEARLAREEAVPHWMVLSPAERHRKLAEEYITLQVNAATDKPLGLEYENWRARRVLMARET